MASPYAVLAAAAGYADAVTDATRSQDTGRPAISNDGKPTINQSRRQSRPRSPAEPESVGSNALQGAAAPAVNPHDRQAALALLTQIGTDFASNRQKSKSKAFEIYQRDLATNSGALVMGGAVTLKELTVLLMDLEAYMKSTQKEGETPSTMLAKFLNGELEVDD